MNPSLPPSIPGTDSPRQILTAMVGCVLSVIAADFLFWGAAPGISLSLFGLILLFVIFSTRSRAVLLGRMNLILGVLLVGALLASAIEISFTNICILLALFIMVSGESSFLAYPRFWARWFSQAGGIILFPGRLFWIWRSTISLLPSSFSGARRVTGWFVGVLFPVLLLTVLFAVVLGAGNAILGTWISRFFSELWNWIASFDFSAGRVLFWAFVALLSLALIRPARTTRIWWAWLDKIVRFAPPAKQAQAYWRSILTLVALNAVFFAANSIDCFYLWARQSIPQGVIYSQFVHQGTAQLITATLLSAVVLMLLFNQDESLSRRVLLRSAALAWIGQNLFLLASIALRLKLYIDAYDLTSQRISVLIFLLIVAGGFMILACKILLEKSLLWLFAANAALVFSVFYVVQFLDLGAAAAGYNVSRWEREPTRQLDLAYIQNLGPGGWAALQRIAERSDGSLESSKASEALGGIRIQMASIYPNADWRSWQARRAWDLHQYLFSALGNR